MLKDLIIIRIKSMFAMGVKSNKKGVSMGKKVLLGLLAAYLILVFGALFGLLFAAVCDPFASIGLSWLYFGLMGLMVFGLCFIGSVFITQNQLYEAKDNDLLLSMPVPVNKILISRLASIIVLDYLYEALIVIPGIIVYCIKQPISALGVIFFIVGFILLPMLVMTFSALFGWLIAIISSKMRNTKIVTLVLTMVFFLGYMYLCLQLEHYINVLAQNGETISEVIRKAMPPFYYLGDAVAGGNVLSFVIFVLCCIVPFVAVCYILMKSFIKIATSNKGRKKIEYRARTLKGTGIRTALFKKELAHFLGSPMYIFNAALGLVFMVVGAVYLLFKSDAIVSVLASFGGIDIVGPAICAIIGVMSALTIISSATISIDAKVMWIMGSSPVRTQDTLQAKANLHTYVSLPFVLLSIILVEIALPMSLLNRITVVAVPIVLTVLNAYIGLILNLKFPKFDWVNETDAIKQGLAPFLTMFVSFATVAVPCLIYKFLLNDIMSAEIYTLIMLVVFAAATFALYRYLMTKGAAIYRELQG